jgi:hypothetical protein
MKSDDTEPRFTQKLSTAAGINVWFALAKGTVTLAYWAQE